MADELSPTATTPEAVSAPAEKTAETPNADDETPKPTQLATNENELLKDVQQAREELEAKEKPEPEAKEEKPEAKPEEGEKKEEDGKEPEGLTEAEKNKAAWLKSQRDKNLQESAKIAEERKALDAEKAELEKARSEIAAKQTEKPKEETKADQPATTALENYKEITLTPYQDGIDQNEQAIVDGVASLAKDVQALKTANAEITTLKADLKRLMDLAAPYIPDEKGITQVEVQGAVQYLQSEAVKASEALMAEYGPDSGLQVDPVNLIAALKDYGTGFVNIGEIKPDNFYSEGSILHCWRHANKSKIDELKAKSGEKKEEPKQVPPPVRKSEGQNALPPSYENMSEREKIAFDYQQEVALLNGKR